MDKTEKPAETLYINWEKCPKCKAGYVKCRVRKRIFDYEKNMGALTVYYTCEKGHKFEITYY